MNRCFEIPIDYTDSGVCLQQYNTPTAKNYTFLYEDG